jgi:DNA-binding CsgD family transcriptional regulator
MGSQVCIIHRSAIVRSGLAEILRRNYNCAVSTFSDLNEFKASEMPADTGLILFTEETIAGSGEYLRFMNEFAGMVTCCVVGSGQGSGTVDHRHFISLHDSPDDINERVKAFIETVPGNGGQEEELTGREIEVLKLVALGFSNKEIAGKLFISTHTVISHRKNMTEKLGIKSISGLTVYAIINGYINTDDLDVKDLI